MSAAHPQGPASGAQDAAQLQALGYAAKFDRSMSFWQNFALGFTYLSPVCGVYAMFGFGLAAGGPPMIWSYVIAGCGQMLVALIFGEIVSQFPITGGLYPWSRRLVGKRWAWMAGWIYAWGLFTTVAAVAVGAGPFLTVLLGLRSSPELTGLLALGLILASTGINLRGTKLLARVAMFGFICEIVGAIVVGAYIVLFHRTQSPLVVFDRFGIGAHGSYLPAFMAAVLVGAYSCYGFEACGDVAEETADPARAIPKAMRMTIYIGAGASLFIALALLLGVPDIRAVISGRETDPIMTILKTAFGPLGAYFVLAVVLVSFLSNVLSIQAAVSRLIYAYARDGMVAGSTLLSRLSPGTHIPSPALVLSGIIPALIVCLGYFAQDTLDVIVSFCTAGIYIAFQMVVAAALYARLRGWSPGGPFTLGRWSWPINLLALIYGLTTIVNILWPRGSGQHWYSHYSILATVIAFVGTGALYMIFATPYERGVSPAGDAWRIGGGGPAAERAM